ncbi:MAG: hypothetical protein IE922_13215 [Sphingomonadales bacterium]|nr:hypothetical protein [Sphingomonadales bacterium]
MSRVAPWRHGLWRRWLWRGAGLFAAVQLLWFAAMAVWPPEAGVAGAVQRIVLWQEVRGMLWQMWIGAPVLVALALGARSWMVRLMLGFALFASTLIGALVALDLSLVQTAVAQGAPGSAALGQMLDLTRLFACALGLAAVLLVRLAWRAESAAPPLAQPAAE